jgi:PAS domain S-box-containing protein
LTISPLKDDSGQVVGASKIMRDVTERRAAERQLSASRESLRLTLASIGDAVITTDVEGRITYLNSVAESTTGWNLQDAVGQSLNTVFRILNEQTRMTVEDPTRRALREGVIVGLANHTLLIRKDATERPIDDSAAPIKDEQGRIAGCVLVFRDISGRRAAEKQIQGLMAELRQADRRKDEFLAMLAHELRGPLAPMCNMLEIIRRTAGQDKLVQQAHATMDRQLMQLVRLVDDLLDVSRITHNRLKLHKERVELSAVVAQAVEMCQATAERSKHELTIDLPREPIYLNGDPARLAQVFGNLLNNACKYTEPGGRIWLTGKRQGSDVLVSVKDTGIGIPRHMLPQIFEVFTQGGRTLERSQGGLGIGLALAKRLVEMHDGVIEAFSQGPGLGSEFVVRLPLLVETQPAQLPPPPDQEPQSPKPRRILVVDDNLDSANSLSRLLEMVGNETFTAHDGLKAVEAAEQFRPEVMLLDIGLPTMNGYDACRRIRSQPWGKKILLIALTGWGQEEDRRQSKEAGFDFHLVKPVKLADLEKLMADAPAESQRQS